MKCKFCGHELAENTRFCGVCGSEVTENTREQPQIISEIKCTDCVNTDGDSDAVCGVRSQRTADRSGVYDAGSAKCSFCGNYLEPSAAFCGNCGNSINKTPATGGGNKTGNNAILIVFIALLTVAVIGLAGVITYTYYQNNIADDEIIRNEFPQPKDDNRFRDNTKKSDKPEEREIDEERNDYIFPSDREYITESDLYGKSMEEVAFIRNEIYARYGYIFVTEPFKSYFEGKEWYTPNPGFSDDDFNEIERANKDFIVEYETEKGWR